MHAGWCWQCSDSVHGSLPGKVEQEVDRLEGRPPAKPAPTTITEPRSCGAASARLAMAGATPKLM
jgi:hypothetical protein